MEGQHARCGNCGHHHHDNGGHGDAMDVDGDGGSSGLPRAVAVRASLEVPTVPATEAAAAKRRAPGRTAVRVVCLSDTHSWHDAYRRLPRGDILIHAGDLTSMGEAGTVRSLGSYFGRHRRSAEAPGGFDHIVCIAGNHDVSLHDGYYLGRGKWRKFQPRGPLDPSECRAALRRHSVYLEDEEHAAMGLRIYGSPWTVEFYDWAFNLPENRIERVWERIPAGIDVLVTHGPPYGRCDFTNKGQHAGCRHLLNHVQGRVRPLLHVFGHIHEGYGASWDGQTLFVNASSLDNRYGPVNPCVVVDVPVRSAGRPAPASREPARIVEPNCTVGDLGAWLHRNGYRQLSAYADSLRRDQGPCALPSGNRLVGPDAFQDVAEALRLHRDPSAQAELRRALLHVHAES